jgi:response regulator of citrate/malate metabolism
MPDLHTSFEKPEYLMKHTINKNPPRFILLDDDLFALAFAEKIIRRNNRRAGIITFSAAEEAIKYMESKDFMGKDTDTVFLTDLHMPEIDGFALLDRMEDKFRAMKERLHIFVLSAAACPAEVKRVFSYSCVIGFISKPFCDDKMEQIIDCIRYPL